MKQRVTVILKLGTPIILAMLSQSLLNLVDAALVGPLGEVALAAVGAGSYANFVALSLVAGLSAGIQAQVARRAGADNDSVCAYPVNHGILLSIVLTLPVSIILMLMAPWILMLFSQSPEVHEAATLYFRIRVMTLTAAAMCLSFRGYWNGLGKPSGFLKILVFSHICNVLISYVLIYGKVGIPAMGVAGAAMGTFLSMYLAVLLCLAIMLRQSISHGFMAWASFRDFSGLIKLMKLALPDSLQQTLFALGIMAFFAIISQLGTGEMAVAHVLMNISLLLILPGTGLGMAATTLVSRSLGAGEPEQAWRWGWEITLVAVFILMLLSLPLLLVPEGVLQLFLYDPELIDVGRIPLQLTGLGIILDTASLVFTRALLGAGANRTVLGIRISSQWLLLLPLCWIAGPVLGLGLTTIWCIQVFQRLVSSLAFVTVWQLRHWSRITI
ncbi:MAG: MATE family efflux transporter [Endozoicomonas sp.]